MIYPPGGGAKCHGQKEGVIYLWEGVIYPLGGGDLPHQNTSPRAPVGAKNDIKKFEFEQVAPNFRESSIIGAFL